MKTYLKVKLLSLWEEAKIIKNEEQKALRLVEQGKESYFDVFRGLYGHRKGIVAQEQRATFIAYNFLRGIPLIASENKPVAIPVKILSKAARMAVKHGRNTVKDPDGRPLGEKKRNQLILTNFQRWVQDALDQYESWPYPKANAFEYGRIHDIKQFLSLISDTPDAIYKITISRYFQLDR